MANEKLIYANDLITAILDDPYIHGRAYARVRDHIDDAPTVDAVEVVRGRWIEQERMLPWCDDDVDVFYDCSVCGCHNYGETPYCPNCGAKMDGGNDDG